MMNFKICNIIFSWYFLHFSSEHLFQTTPQRQSTSKSAFSFRPSTSLTPPSSISERQLQQHTPTYPIRRKAMTPNTSTGSPGKIIWLTFTVPTF